MLFAGSMRAVPEMADWYLWFKVVHVVAVFAWMAGLFYLPRLFVYHAGVQRGTESDLLFLGMERRLLTGIMNPAAAVSWIFGLLTAWSIGALAPMPVWLLLKIALVAGMTVFHLFLGACHRNFADGKNLRSSNFYRVINEFPTLLLVFIVVLVVAKPFGL